MEAVLRELNPAQNSAVTSSSDILQVLAPPGSGKTKTLTARVAYLLVHHGYQPQNIICCTFTIKAAKEMRERLKGVIGDQLETKLILGTFHSICLRYLKRYGHLIDLPTNFGVTDATESLAIIRKIVKSRRMTLDDKAARARISRRKAQGYGFVDHVPQNAKSIEKQEFEEIYEAYQKELDKSGRLDYDDLLLRCQQLLSEHPGCVANVECVLIDEFQDTNVVQYELMKLFASCRRRITIVGDPDQSIYGFRSAEIRNLSRMKQHYPKTTAIFLEENYRSCGAILSAAQKVIEQDTARPQKQLQATHSHGSLPVLRKLPSSKAEAAWIVLEIQRSIAMSGNMFTHSDFSILLRSAHLSRQIETELGRAGIPYQMVGGFRFYDRFEVRLLLDYLKVVYQQANSEAVLAIVNTPARKIGDKSRKDLQDEASAKGLTLFEWLRKVTKGERSSNVRLSNTARQNLASFVQLIVDCRNILDSLPTAAEVPKKLLEILVKKLSLKQYLEDNYNEDAESRWANVEELLIQAEDASKSPEKTASYDELPSVSGFEQQQERHGLASLSQFLANISLSAQADALEDDAVQHRVTISTIHAAKGLEWPVVFIPALYNGSIPHSRAEDTDEERRLLYVAMTRAQVLLNLSWPFQQAGSQEETTLSSFMTPHSERNIFRDHGPEYTDNLLETIARNLRRPLSSQAEIYKGIENLRSTKDDLWPTSGERGELDNLLRDGLNVMQRADDVGYEKDSFRSILRQHSNSFNRSDILSEKKPTISTGFTTASEQLKSQPPLTAVPSEPAPVSPTKNKKRKRPPPDQLGISSFFGTNSKRQVPPDRDFKIVAALPQRKLTSSVSAPEALPSLSRHNPRPHIPSGLSSHRLGTTVSLKRPRTVLEEVPNSNKKTYTFLSSSPPPPDEQKDAIDAEDRRQKSKVVDEISKQKPAGFRPASTFHTTSIAALQQSHSLGPARKTYGVRRSMNGWGDRMNR
ncbi:MAG: hypothetical protein Q9227_004123 [Pyrenula ochraceoflavens]